MVQGSLFVDSEEKTANKRGLHLSRRTCGITKENEGAGEKWMHRR